MKKILIAVLVMLFLAGCSNRNINGREQSFLDYVILNKYSTYQKGEWRDQPGENFPGIRFLNWIEASDE